MNRLIVLFLLTIASGFGFSKSEAQQIREIYGGNAIESAAIVIDGDFELGLADRFELFMETERPGAFKVFLNSQGGNLLEGLKLGLMIRKYGLWTSVSKAYVDDSGMTIFDNGTVCASACAYAFLGGVQRFFDPESQLGFHQFYRNQGVDTLLQEFISPGTISIESQRTSSLIVWYLSELGDVSPNIFVIAAEEAPNEMHWVTQSEATELKITTNIGFGEFWMEPFGNGVIAASRRLDSATGYEPLYPYALVAQVTMFCKAGGQKVVMLSLPYKPHIDPSRYLVEWEFGFQNGVPSSFFDTNSFSLRGNNQQGWVDIPISNSLAQSIVLSSRISVTIALARASGGILRYSRMLNDMDRAMISSAFSLCV